MILRKILLKLVKIPTSGYFFTKNFTISLQHNFNSTDFFYLLNIKIVVQCYILLQK